MLQNLTGMHALVILAVVILLFGAAKLPALAKSVGQSVKILKDETSDDKSDNNRTDSEKSTAENAPAAAAVPAESAAPAVSDDAAYVAPVQVQAHPQAQRTA
jgi:sec-independent protein translocase protein TatA